jgi:LysM repeat protein
MYRHLYSLSACVLILAILFLIGLTVPAFAQTSPCSAETYVVQAGESLYSIAIKCGIPYAALVGINVEIHDPNMIRPGQVIRLEASVPLYTTPAAGPAQPGGLNSDGDYIARPGDSLARIAFLYRTNIPDILRANPNLRKDWVIVPGQVIHLPADARRVKGWVGVSALTAGPGDIIVVRVVDFPPNADLEINIGELDIDNTVLVYDTVLAKSDANGSARVKITLPYYAWYNEEWVFEVVASAATPQADVLSPIITIK